MPATLLCTNGVPHASCKDTDVNIDARSEPNTAAECRSESTKCDAAEAATAASRCDTAGGTGNDYRVLYYGDERSLI